MKIFFAIIFAIISTGILALGQTGHRITGELAQRHINSQTQIALNAILGNESLAEVSTYPDEMRASSDHFWKETQRPYHYVTVPVGKTYKEVGAPKQGDAFYALDKYSKVIKSKSSTKQEKIDAIKLIVHIIGDLHQPLHAGNGEDHGGNRFKVKFFRKETNLHSVWDTQLIERRHLSFTEWTNWLDKEITAKDKKNWRSNDPAVWIEESVKIRDRIYPKDPSISFQYQFKNMPIIQKRLKQAGIRIAYYLDELLK